MHALWMVLASLLFASMAVCVKFAAAYFHSAELVFYRGLIGVLLVGVLARAQAISLRTRVPGMHAWRASVGVVSLGAWFYAIAYLPLATAISLNYMSSVWMACFLVGAALIARPSSTVGARLAAQGPLILTILIGFGGVVLTLRPTLGSEQLVAGLVGVLSGTCAALAYLQVTTLARLGEPDTRTVFYFAVGSSTAGGVGAAVSGWSAWIWPQALWLLPLGLLASLGQLCVTRAFRQAGSQGSTLVVANLQYLGIVFSAIYGLLLFGDALPLSSWLGMGLIVASGIAATVLRTRSQPPTGTEEPL